MKARLVGTGCAVVLALAFGACDRKERNERPKEQQHVEGKAVSPAAHAAVNAITTARCAREARCNNIGADKKYESQSDCLTRVETEWRAEFADLECGIDQKELDECVTAIREEDCGNAFDKMSSVAACRASDICA